MKVCCSCKLQHPLEAFSRKAASPDGRHSKCKACHNAYVKSVWYPANREKQVRSSNKWKRDNPDRVIANRLRVPVSQVINAKSRSGGCCEACGARSPLVVDHCHETSVVRGILCSPCNVAIGMLGDKPLAVKERIQLIAAYLDRHLQNHGYARPQ
ncbi:endonuclease domain-containing protein [Chelatococcus sp. HY11]|uniref:endonuclease domain-containing protein n=1 Tax=Chelatococcus sp. TaxID=1953771 RepID=UPI001BD09524|nr:hypothetical protein [Chelatococcus sp. HY11]MBX3544525.1 hypothetical protein [Chelatococcus sp.]